ncbi:MAG: histidinol-phosphate transaminase [Balneolia bacterium]|nr:histidinol-phosphate transaminase [Balneolia bacterium]
MKFDLNQLLRPNIRGLKPYRSARDDFKSGILLDANENPASPGIEHALNLNRYPDPHYELLRNRISEIKEAIKPEQIFLGNGSDEAIDLLIRMFCTPGHDKILITPPTYGMYKVSADIHGIETVEAPLLPDFSLDADSVLSKTDGVKIIFLCSPNNPTANRLQESEIRRVIEGFSGIVVVDEAYIDFSRDKSLLPLLAEHPNLVVMQTLSKAWGLAGIRLGMAFASTEIINYMMRVKPPYNVNSLTQDAALKALGNPNQTQRAIESILSERDRVAKSLEQMDGVIRVEESDANFLLVRVKNAPDVYRKLAKLGVIVRYRGDQLHCENGLRITIGLPEENDALLDAMEQLTISN